MLSKEFDKLTDVRLLHHANARSQMQTTEEGMVIEVRPDNTNVPVRIVSIAFDKVIEVRLVVPRKAHVPILVTEFGMLMEVRLLQL